MTDVSDLEDIKEFIQEVEDCLDDLDGTSLGELPKALDYIASRAAMARRLCDSMIPRGAA